MTKVVSKRVRSLTQKEEVSCVLCMLLNLGFNRLLGVTDILFACKGTSSLVHDDLASTVAVVDAFVFLPAVAW